MLQFKRHKCIKTGFPVSLQAYQPRQGRKPSGRFFYFFCFFVFFYRKLFCVLCNFFSFGMNLRLTIETALLDFIYEKQEWLITSVVHHKTNIFPTHFKQMNKEHCKRHIQYYIQYPTK